MGSNPSCLIISGNKRGTAGPNVGCQSSAPRECNGAYFIKLIKMAEESETHRSGLEPGRNGSFHPASQPLPACETTATYQAADTVFWRKKTICSNKQPGSAHRVPTRPRVLAPSALTLWRCCSVNKEARTRPFAGKTVAKNNQIMSTGKCKVTFFLPELL